MIKKYGILISIILLALVACQAVSAESYVYVDQFGSAAGPGQLGNPWGIAPYGSQIYVVNEMLDNVKFFGNYGTTFINYLGNTGSFAGYLIDPRGVAVDTSGFVYVADAGNDRVQKYQVIGNSAIFVTNWGSYGSAAGQFKDPSGVAIDSYGYVYVADALNDRVQVFDNNGGYIRTIIGNFANPQGVAVANSYVYVTDTGHNQVKIFGNYGTDLIGNFGSSGAGAGQFNMPHGIAVDASGYVYVVDTNNNRVQKFTSDGVYVTTFGTAGIGNGQFNAPRDIFVQVIPGGQRVYVSDWGNNRVQVFAQYTPTPSGGGGGGTTTLPPALSVGTASLLTNSQGQLLRAIILDSPSLKARLSIGLGVYALDKNGAPLSEISMNDVAAANLPAVPSGGTFEFAGYAVECSPTGATFSPSARLTFSFTEAEWSAIMTRAHNDQGQIVVKWYNAANSVWVNMPTTVNVESRSVAATITHFSVFALFADTDAPSAPVTPVITPVVTPGVTPGVTTTVPATPVIPTDGFPWTYVVIGIIVILLIAGGAYYYTRKE